MHESGKSFRGGHLVWSIWGIILGVILRGHYVGHYVGHFLKSFFWGPYFEVILVLNGTLWYFLILCVVLMWDKFVKSLQADSTGLGGGCHVCLSCFSILFVPLNNQVQ